MLLTASLFITASPALPFFSAAGTVLLRASAGLTRVFTGGERDTPDMIYSAFLYIIIVYPSVTSKSLTIICDTIITIKG